MKAKNSLESWQIFWIDAIVDINRFKNLCGCFLALVGLVFAWSFKEMIGYFSIIFGLMFWLGGFYVIHFVSINLDSTKLELMKLVEEEKWKNSLEGI